MSRRARRYSEVVATSTGPVRVCGDAPLTDESRAAIGDISAAARRMMDEAAERIAPMTRTCMRAGFERYGCTFDIGSCWCPTEHGECDGPVGVARAAARRAGATPPGVTALPPRRG